MMALDKSTVLITGATSGIGKAAAVDLAKQGVTLVFNSRDLQRGESVREEIIRESGNSSIHVLPCDFASLQQVKAFAEQFLAQFPALHVLINNAGAFFPSYTTTKDGLEATFAVNHLAPFYLTQLLLERLKASAPARIITVSSAAHKGQTLDLGNTEASLLLTPENYSALKAYGQSKLANILFTKTLAHKLEGTQVMANSLHPGVIRTRITRRANWLLQAGFLAIGKSVKKGADTILYLAKSEPGGKVSGEYFVNRRQTATSKVAQDTQLAAQLWQFSEEKIQQLT
ncbi:MAG: SDR family oxidoreductase [Bacteroidota bacterium]